MDADIDGVATLVDDLDHLLETTVLQWHPDQSAKLADTVVHMHHIVAHLELLNLLQCQGHLATAGLVALEVVLVESVEDLMVCKQAEACIHIDKTFVEGLVNRDKLDALLHLGKDVLQSLLLLGAVCQDIEFETLQQIVFQCL